MKRCIYIYIYKLCLAWYVIGKRPDSVLFVSGEGGIRVGGLFCTAMSTVDSLHKVIITLMGSVRHRKLGVIIRRRVRLEKY